MPLEHKDLGRILISPADNPQLKVIKPCQNFLRESHSFSLVITADAQKPLSQPYIPNLPFARHLAFSQHYWSYARKSRPRRIWLSHRQHHQLVLRLCKRFFSDTGAR